MEQPLEAIWGSEFFPRTCRLEEPGDQAADLPVSGQPGQPPEPQPPETGTGRLYLARDHSKFYSSPLYWGRDRSLRDRGKQSQNCLYG